MKSPRQFFSSLKFVNELENLRLGMHILNSLPFELYLGIIHPEKYIVFSWIWSWKVRFTEEEYLYEVLSKSPWKRLKNSHTKVESYSLPSKWSLAPSTSFMNKKLPGKILFDEPVNVLNSVKFLILIWFSYLQIVPTTVTQILNLTF